MKIIIAGGGKVGLTLTRQLSEEGYDITLIDTESSVLEDAVNRYDVMGVKGNCASMAILKEADVENADLLIATLGADEVNLLCCMTAHCLNEKIHTIARIRDPEYGDQIHIMRNHFGISMVINPESHAAMEMEKLIRLPGFLHRDSFAKNRVEIVELRVKANTPLDHCKLKDFSNIAGKNVLVCGVLRNGTAFIPGGSFELMEGDRIFVTAPTSNLTWLLKNLGIITQRVKNVMLCGAGRISYYLSKRLIKSGINVTIVENNYDKCLYMADKVPKASVIHGDATNLSILKEAGIENCDAIVAMTGYDEMNMLISLYANNVGVQHVITKLVHIESGPMLDNLPLGSIINPKELSSDVIVSYVRAMKNQVGAAISIHAIADGQVEALEFVIDEAVKNKGVPLKDIKLKKGVLIACISHKGKFIIPDGDACYERGDTVIVVTVEKHIVGRINDIFED